MPVVIDVDETLITKFSTVKGDKELTLRYYGETVYANPINRHIRLLKSYKKRGYEVTVWSANGYLWAKQVVEVLDLYQFVDIVASKPLKYVDDKDANTFMQRVFIEK
jgi:predicted phosphatase